MADAASAAGADIQLGASVREVRLGSNHVVVAERDGVTVEEDVEHVWSTLPLPLLARSVRPAPHDDVIAAATKLRFRAMALIYLEVATQRFTAFDAHYFPESAVRITRLSEPKNYGARHEPADRTVLCAELPCDVGDRVWSASDEDLGSIVVDDLERCGLPLPAPVRSVTVRRLSHAYPIYLRGYEERFATLDRWASGLDRVLSFGRQGLFAHDNTHHALAMAYGAVECLGADGSFDAARWARYREEFEGHVVED
jgi:protoporphyrinogen oxidase